MKSHPKDEYSDKRQPDVMIGMTKRLYQPYLQQQCLQSFHVWVHGASLVFDPMVLAAVIVVVVVVVVEDNAIY